jgi:calcium-translocating P-type ATPase
MFMKPIHTPVPPIAPLPPEEVEASRRTHGSNRLSVRKAKSFPRRFFENLGDPVIRILLGALVLNLLVSLGGEGADWVETGGIALAVLLATLISTLSEHGSEAAFAKLSSACGQAFCRVRRRSAGDTHGAGEMIEIPLEEAVVGDIAILGAGEMIPADGVLLSGSLLLDQAAMTGESCEVQKTPLRQGDPAEAELSPSAAHALLRGCVILSGSGEMLVTRVGDSTFLGHISEEVQTDTRESPLKLRLTRLAEQISRLGYVAAALVAVVFLLGVFLLDSEFEGAVILQKLTDRRYVLDQLFHALMLGLTVLVVAVPEGLPMMIAVVLSSNIKRMVKDQVLVRKPVGIEAAGSLNLLFTDKTGTLTEGRLSIGRIVAGDGSTYADTRDLRRAAPRLFGYFSDACRTNTASAAGKAEGDSLRALGGNGTDRALLDAVLPYSAAAHSEVLFSVPFDSGRKTSCALVRREGREVLYVKGAPEILMGRLTDAYRPDGSRGVLDRAALARRIQAMTERGGRVILCAEAVSGRGALPTRARLEGGDYGALTLVCAVLLSDRLRGEASPSVRKLRKAGVHVVMMTGDNRDTAKAIAESCGILGQGVDLVLESRELAGMRDGEIREILPRLGVVARALPADKSRLVRIAQEAELVVGMTGDGINDAPALKRADVGFAMGAGTQVAKDAGDIIILDNNLASMVRAVLYGRTIFKSIRKFITLQLTMNFCAVGVTMICPFIGIDSPVTVVQMLWINLIMDTLGGLAFAGEAPLASYMEEKPKRRDEPILNRYIIGEIAWLGCFTVALCLLFLKLPAITGRFRSATDNIYLLTAFFALFIFASVFNCFNTRTDRLNIFAGLSRNKGFCFIMIAVLTVQILFVYIGGAVLRTVPLTKEEMGVTFLLALTVFPAEFLRKVWRRLSGKTEGY